MPVGPLMFKMLIAATLLVGLMTLGASLRSARPRLRRERAARRSQPATVHRIDTRPTAPAHRHAQRRRGAAS